MNNPSPLVEISPARGQHSQALPVPYSYRFTVSVLRAEFDNDREAANFVAENAPI